MTPDTETIALVPMLYDSNILNILYEPVVLKDRIAEMLDITRNDVDDILSHRDVLR